MTHEERIKLAAEVESALARLPRDMWSNAVWFGEPRTVARVGLSGHSNVSGVTGELYVELMPHTAELVQFAKDVATVINGSRKLLAEQIKENQ